MTSILNFTYRYFQSVVDECVSFVGTSSNLAPNLASNFYGTSQLFENCQGTLVQWFSYDDFQINLLKGFSVLLLVNILFILFAWKVYGERIYETFMKPGE